MRRGWITCCMLVVLALSLVGVVEGQDKAGTAEARSALLAGRASILTSLKELEDEAKKLNAPLAQAVAFAEIADAAWKVDKDWAQSLLRTACELTYPTEDEREQVKGLPGERARVEAITRKLSRDRSRVRRRVLEIAARDAEFAASLARSVGQTLGKTAESNINVSYANQMTHSGDLKSASNYILNAIKAEPTQVWNGYAIYALAEKDRNAADALILQYIRLMEAYPLDTSSLPFIFDSMDVAVFSDRAFDPENRQVRPASPEVIKAYLNFALNKLVALEQARPGSLRQIEGTLPRLWQRANQYAPELRPSFYELSRSVGREAKLPEFSTEEAQRSHDEALLKKATETGDASDVEAAILIAIGQRDFEKARRLAGSFKSEERKAEALEEINVAEAHALIDSRALPDAEKVAANLRKPNNVLEVYISLIKASSAVKDKERARALAFEVVKLLKKYDAPTPAPYLISQLIISVISLDSALAFDLLDEAVQSLNRRQASSDSGEIGFNVKAFAQLAAKDEQRTRQSARSLSDRLQKIVALSSIYQWKAEELAQHEKSNLLRSK